MIKAETPTLQVAATNDKIVPIESSLALNRRLGSELVLLDGRSLGGDDDIEGGGGHYDFTVGSGMITAVNGISDFLRRQDGARSRRQAA